ncbi:hypothetical protein [Romboutsia timonensis]|uniref:hypothetical protein n=1 Tax=Romboutsia timonensis TaxID=1776391 RepID=UPI003993F179
MIELMEENNIVLTEDEKVTLELWYSIVGPIVAKKALGIEDEDVLNAIQHTTGRENMSKLEKIIYIADMIELKEFSWSRGNKRSNIERFR